VRSQDPHTKRFNSAVAKAFMNVEHEPPPSFVQLTRKPELGLPRVKLTNKRPIRRSARIAIPGCRLVEAPSQPARRPMETEGLTHPFRTQYGKRAWTEPIGKRGPIIIAVDSRGLRARAGGGYGVGLAIRRNSQRRGGTGRCRPAMYPSLFIRGTS
jgi:hypothetical protein